jgi:predicted AAA+ superfamily ATPase
MIRILQPWYVNIGKRLVKRPKIYIRDSGIFHNLASIKSHRDLLAYHKLGASWEGFALEQVSKSIGKKDSELYFWKIHSGAEVDLFWQEHGKNWAMEFKFTDAPKLTRSMTSALEQLQLEHLWIVYPGQRQYKMHDKITAIGLQQVQVTWQYNA